MADIAQIGIRVDTRGVREAVQDLKTIPPAANSAEIAVVKLEEAFEEVAKSADKADTSVSKSNDTTSKASNVAAAAAGALTKESAAAEKVAAASGAAAIAVDKKASATEKVASAAADAATSIEKESNATKNIAVAAAAAANGLQNELNATVKIASAADSAATAIEKESAATSKIITMAAAAAGALTKESAAATKVAQASGAAATAVDKKATATAKVASAAQAAATAIEKESAATATVAASATAAASGLERESAAALKAAQAAGTAANQNQKLSQSMNGLAGQTGNIASQFNDIGVSLAGGQSPFIVALQQGTQLNQIFGGQGLTSILRGLGQAFMQVVSPVSLLTIGIISAGGYLLQYFTTAEDGSEKTAAALKEQNDLIRAVAERWGEAVPAVQAYIDQLDRAAEAADLIKVGDILSNNEFADVRDQLDGLNISFADLLLQLETAGEKRENIVALHDSFETLRDKVAEGTVTAEDMKAVTDALAATVNGSGIPAIDTFTAAFSSLAGQIMRAAAAVDKIKASTGAALRGAQGLTPGPYGMNQPLQYEGAPDASQLVTPTERPNIELAGMPGVNYADASGHIKGAKKPRAARKPRKVKSQAELFSEITDGADRDMASLKAQQQAVGLSAEAASRLKRETDLLNQAQQKNVNLNDEQRAKLKSVATEMASVEEATRKAKESLEFAKDVTRGFVDDLRSGLESGKGFWESFGDAALGVLDKITDKLLNQVMDALFEVGSASGGGKGGGGLGGLLGGLFSLFSAKGNVFAGGNVQAFAKGGAFSNSVVTKPTAFAIGQMGEAGPEAIMPLKRGPDGSLGVQSHKGGSRSGGAQVIDFNLNLRDDSGRMSEIAQQEFKTQSGEIIRASVKTVKQQLPSMIQDSQRRGSSQ